MCAVAIALAGCATPDARDFRGRWTPLNQFADTPRAIPLRQGYVYQATPVDGTLKHMLDRWARDSKLELAYQHPNDYTLHAQVARIRAHDIRTAAAELTSAYAGEGVRVDVDGSRLRVADARSATIGPSNPDAPSD
ncbi:hypothetical protein [Luteimonas kalidii]|uniref:Toxin co-regulated pilus biosynthesis protein Q C-terminal domain-containing protein n=1 Tax=Luteimonas kalidii TaxID=3042025 RepID=A0ABT6JV46_9GAMM|nr:hypothetical protein [Luteimonas kalidii]MDH5834563.1 hypothetical protein [Luteimonas kalidii]